MVDFVISAFDSSIEMGVSGSLEKVSYPDYDVSATAVFFMNRYDFYDTFKFQIDSNDITDVSSDDIIYYTYAQNFPRIIWNRYMFK